jgi:phage-related protein
MLRTMRQGAPPKELVWVRSSLEDLKKFPREAQREIGFALKAAQFGGKHPDAKVLKGFGGASVLEVVESNEGEEYRAVYTVRFADAVYVLHAFHKKSKKGIATPQREMARVKERLKYAEEIHQKGAR